jgi:glycosyltransferase involved in cell wall biosynthesis
LLTQEHPAIVHTHRYKESILGGLASRAAGRPKLIKTVHGLQERFSLIKQIKSSAYSALEYLITRLLFDRVICVSEEIRRQLSGSVPADRLVRIRNGVDVEACVASRSRATVRSQLNLPEATPVLGTVARLVPIKGIDLLLRAVVSLKTAIPDVRTVVVGDGPERDRLERLAIELGLGDSVIFTGHRDDALDLIAAMDLFVLSSLSEGIPMAVLESMALGTPVVATRVGGVPEILSDGNTGVLVPAGDTKALAAALERMLVQREIAREMSDRARLAVAREHSAECMCREVAALYHQLAG